MRSNQRERLGANRKPGIHQGKSKSALVGGQRAGRSSGKKETMGTMGKMTRVRAGQGSGMRDVAREGKGRANDGAAPRGREEDRARARTGERVDSQNKPKRGGTKAIAAPTGRDATTRRKMTGRKVAARQGREGNTPRHASKRAKPASGKRR